jgi:hypothetical protein
MTFLSKPRKSRSANSFSFGASQGMLALRREEIAPEHVAMRIDGAGGSEFRSRRVGMKGDVTRTSARQISMLVIPGRAEGGGRSINAVVSGLIFARGIPLKS